MAPTLPLGYKLEHGIAWGSREKGLLEISYFNHKRKNSVTGEGQMKMARLIEAAQSDVNIKVILIHGGLYYCSRNDLSALAQSGSMEEEEKIEAVHMGAYQMMTCLFAIFRSKKPIVGLVRGQAIGIGFTTVGLFDFVYCTPDA